LDLTGVLGATAAGDGDTGMAVATIGTVGIVVAPGRHGETGNCVGNAAGLMACGDGAVEM